MYYNMIYIYMYYNMITFFVCIYISYTIFSQDWILNLCKTEAVPVPAWAADEADPFDGSMPEEVGLLGPRRPRAVENMAFPYNENYKTMEHHHRNSGFSMIFPLYNSMVIFDSYVNVYQRVYN